MAFSNSIRSREEHIKSCPKSLHRKESKCDIIKDGHLRLTTDDLKISNGDIAAPCQPIHFMFGSRVGFSGSADRTVLLLIGPNPRWQ